MKKVLFFIALSVLLVSCATNGCVGRGYGPATGNLRTNVDRVYIPVKEPDKPSIAKSKPLKSNGRYSNVGAKPPKPTKSNVE